MFGQSGLASVQGSFGAPGGNYATSVALQADGKLVISGWGFIARLNADGTPDSTFGRNGVVALEKSYAALTVQQDGKFLLAVPGTTEWSIVRLNKNGSPDLDFGDLGVVRTRIGPTTIPAHTAMDVVELPSGRILAMGHSGYMTDRELTVVRYHSDGTLDESFGTDGISTAEGPQGEEMGIQGLVRSSGEIYVAGTWQTATGTGFAVAAFRSDGSVNTAYGSQRSGVATAAVQVWSGGASAALQNDGKVLVAAQSAPDASGAKGTTVVRFTAAGVLDAGFGKGGVLKLPDLGAGSDWITSVEVQADGRILLAGTGQERNPDGSSKLEFLVVRLHADGSLDHGFGDGGVARHDAGGGGTVYDMLLQPDGRIVIAGGGAGQPAVLRLYADGSLDDGLFLTGTPAAERVVGETGADHLQAGAGNDMLDGYGGDDVLDGGAGIDTALFVGARSEYLVRLDSNGWVVQDRQSGRNGTDELVGIERLKFADGYLALDLLGNAGQAYRLYQAAFDRTPDIAGLGYQINALDEGLSLTQVAQNFIDSPEFARTYGALNDLQFVTQLYANVLDRAPDAAGLAFHTGNLAAGMSRAAVLEGFSESPENQANVLGAIYLGIAYTL